jgi:hypothetical protein
MEYGMWNMEERQKTEVRKTKTEEGEVPSKFKFKRPKAQGPAFFCVMCYVLRLRVTYGFTVPSIQSAVSSSCPK